jgi:hypothetical protein
MVRYEVEGPFPTREAAEAAERAAIGSERPLLNGQHMGGSLGLDYGLSLYLADRGIPIATVGLHRCPTCLTLRGHHLPPGVCGDCRDAEEEGRLDEWVQYIAELNRKYRIEMAA